MDKVVGIVGLGIMGGAMARNLVERGWQVHGFDPDEARRTELAGAGVSIAPDLAALAAAAPTLIASLPSPGALQATAGGLANAKLPRPVTLIEASTLALDDKIRAEETLRAAGHLMLDCPISGTGAQAKTRDIVVYASGDSARIAALGPLFADFTRAVHDVGVFGNGSRMKFVANLLVAIHNVASAEAMVLGMKAGLDPNQIVDLISSGVGTSRIFELRAPMMAADRYEPATMKVDVWGKDMSVIGAFKDALGVSTPLFDATGPIYEAALAEGHAAEDTASVCTVLERRSGLERGRG